MAGLLPPVDVQHGLAGCGDAAAGRRVPVEHLRLRPRPWHPHHGGVPAEGAQLLLCGRRGDHHHLQLRALAQDVLQQPQQHVRGHRALLRLVQHHHPVLPQQRVRRHLPQQHLVRAVPACAERDPCVCPSPERDPCAPAPSGAQLQGTPGCAPADPPTGAPRPPSGSSPDPGEAPPLPRSPNEARRD